MHESGSKQPQEWLSKRELKAEVGDKQADMTFFFLQIGRTKRCTRSSRRKSVRGAGTRRKVTSD